MINFSSYNYVGLSGDPVVDRGGEGRDRALRHVGVGEPRRLGREAAAPRARARAGATSSAPRTRSCCVSGHATNVTVIGHLLGPGRPDPPRRARPRQHHRRREAVRRQAAAVPAQRLARRSTATLARAAPPLPRVLIAIEGIYSMDGDIPRLAEFIEVKKRHDALLLVDEAHSLGVLGATGRGIGEHYDVDRGDVDMWMGTLSQVAGAAAAATSPARKALVEYLKYTAPGVRLLRRHLAAERGRGAGGAAQAARRTRSACSALQKRARLFLELCRERGIDTGMSEGLGGRPGDHRQLVRLPAAVAGAAPARHQRAADPLSGGGGAPGAAALLHHRAPHARAAPHLRRRGRRGAGQAQPRLPEAARAGRSFARLIRGGNAGETPVKPDPRM